MPKKKRTLSIDFTGVEAGGGGRLLPEGPRQFEVEDATIETGADSGKEYVQLVLKSDAGDEFDGTKAYDNLSTQPQALWKMRGFMEAAGLATEDGVMEIDPEEFVGLVVVGDVIHEDYKGKPKHRINGYSAVEDSGATTPGGGKSGAGATVKKKPSGGEKDETPEWKKGQKAAFMDGKKRLEGVVTAIDGDTVTVKVGRDEYEMALTDLETP